ncbi:ribonuclease P protein component [Chitinivorax tropicus]|uniref:Ribonuclease P protein component n=1 Tax=Chitinivorax tropicus TaxID=714531 RepID=A0A840MM66_9PROT|nr:ribonuclease P protein component [Chitinivorax tropicus]MBB5020244.1 ribonuclease P protein component [Chitinivorax tropicus]
MSRFGRDRRLLKTDEFSSVFNFRCSVRGEFLQVLGKRNDLSQARLGIVVSKKLAKQAVRRNTMKRLVRETFRLNDGELAGLDVIVWPRQAFGHEEAAVVRAEMLELFRRIRRKCRASSSP